MGVIGTTIRASKIVKRNPKLAAKSIGAELVESLLTHAGLAIAGNLLFDVTQESQQPAQVAQGSAIQLIPASGRG